MLAVVQDLREVGAARVEIEIAPSAMVNESQHFISAGVASPPGSPRRSVVKLKVALVVEGVRYAGTGCGAGLVQVELASQALVLEAYPGFFAAVAVEGDFRVLELELVVWMDGVRDFLVNLHDGVLVFWPILHVGDMKCLYMQVIFKIMISIGWNSQKGFFIQ